MLFSIVGLVTVIGSTLVLMTAVWAVTKDEKPRSIPSKHQHTLVEAHYLDGTLATKFCTDIDCDYVWYAMDHESEPKTDGEWQIATCALCGYNVKLPEGKTFSCPACFDGPPRPSRRTPQQIQASQYAMNMRSAQWASKWGRRNEPIVQGEHRLTVESSRALHDPHAIRKYGIDPKGETFRM